MGSGYFNFTESCENGRTVKGSRTIRITLRIGKIKLVARIARPVALYGASASAQTAETIDETIVNPIDFEEVGDVNVARLIDMGPYSHMPGFDDFSMDIKRGESR